MTDKTDEWDFEHAPRLAEPEASLRARIATLEADIVKLRAMLSEAANYLVDDGPTSSWALGIDMAQRIRKELGK